MKIVARGDLKEYPTQVATGTIDYVATDTWGNTAARASATERKHRDGRY